MIFRISLPFWINFYQWCLHFRHTEGWLYIFRLIWWWLLGFCFKFKFPIFLQIPALRLNWWWGFFSTESQEVALPGSHSQAGCPFVRATALGSFWRYPWQVPKAMVYKCYIGNCEVIGKGEAYISRAIEFHLFRAFLEEESWLSLEGRQFLPTWLCCWLI